MTEKQTYVDVIVPLALPGYFTYLVPQSLSKFVESGKRVVVQFGKKRMYTAIVCNVHHNKPDFEIKEVLQVIDTNPIINPIQLSFWNWLSMYYMCSPGEVLKAALPSGLKLESESVILHGSDFNKVIELTDEEIIIVEMLRDKESIYVEEVIKVLEKKNIFSVLGSLVLKKIIVVDDCSTDNSFKIIKEMARKYSQVIALQTPKNTGGAAGAKNYGL